MLVAKSESSQHIVLGTEIRPQNNTHNRPSHGLSQDLVCPACSRKVSFSSTTSNNPFGFFAHDDGSRDCFDSESMSDGHRIAVEVAVKVIHNRINEITGERVEINVEKWIGTRSNFVITDIRITHPLRIAAEIFYKTKQLGLRRRLNTMFSNDYSTYLIFNTKGCHDIDNVERHIQRLAPLKVGRFYPEILELTLGNLFNKHQLTLSQSDHEIIPDYILR